MAILIDRSDVVIFAKFINSNHATKEQQKGRPTTIHGMSMANGEMPMPSDADADADDNDENELPRFGYLGVDPCLLLLRGWIHFIWRTQEITKPSRIMAIEGIVVDDEDDDEDERRITNDLRF